MNPGQSNLELKPEATTPGQSIVSAYEAPAIESVLTPESLEREVHYAGKVISGVAKT